MDSGDNDIFFRILGGFGERASQRAGYMLPPSRALSKAPEVVMSGTVTKEMLETKGQ